MVFWLYKEWYEALRKSKQVMKTLVDTIQNYTFISTAANKIMKTTMNWLETLINNRKATQYELTSPMYLTWDNIFY